MRVFLLDDCRRLITSFSLYYTMVLELELKGWIFLRDFYRCRFQKFGTPSTVEDYDAMELLASVVRHFLPLVVENKKLFWTSLKDNAPLAKYVTASDLAFTVLVLEHHIAKWRHIVQMQKETGWPPSQEYSRKADELLLYPDGIAGEEAKRRFDVLTEYFHTYFFCPKKGPRNIGVVESSVNTHVKSYPDNIQQEIDACLAVDQEMVNACHEEIQEEVFHRVFYYMYS